jgi:hypothetical protein
VTLGTLGTWADVSILFCRWLAKAGWIRSSISRRRFHSEKAFLGLNRRGFLVLERPTDNPKDGDYGNEKNQRFHGMAPLAIKMNSNLKMI